LRVAFNARLLWDRTLRGWNRYTVNLLAELSQTDLELFLYSDRPLHRDHLARLRPGSFQVVQSNAMRYLRWEQSWLPRQCALDSIDILHTPINFGVPWRCPCPRVMTLHDAIDSVHYRSPLRWWQRFAPRDLQSRLYHRMAASNADRIITVSNHAKNDLVSELGLDSDKIAVIYEAADARFGVEIDSAIANQVATKYQIEGRYVFYVGGWEARKNLPFLLRAFAEAELHGVSLVLAGGKNEERDYLAELARALSIADRTKLIGWVDDDDLPALYANALCFVYPSEYEGFGLQLCEAMASWCPTLAARATSLPEVLGNGGELFSLDSVGELAHLLRKTAQDETYRSELVNKAKTRAKDFSWKTTAASTIAVYRSMLAKQHKEMRVTETEDSATRTDENAREHGS
jgi:glycosyltransferase involved in cell wall biosynthesis